ncbi:MAG: phytanoyl-CoA dioxygenase family protein [Nitriliruptorales bacterium]|nr:phytanoyl-CoA dioxygenase family protein [Nitriliruptorales bacterium]
MIDAVEFHDTRLPELLASERGAMAGAAAAHLPPLAIHVDDHAWTHRSVDRRLQVSRGVADDAVAIRVSAQTWSDWHTETLRVPGMLLTQSVEVAPEHVVTLSEWDLALRALWNGVPVYDKETVELSVDGRPVDLARSFTLDDPPDEIARHLEIVGFVRIREVFSPDEIAALNAEVDRLATTARPGDGRSWWSDQPDGTEILNRIIYAQEGSQLIDDLYADERLDRLGRILDPELRPAKDRMDGASLLIKPPGELVGLANIPWHQDCGMGGHNYMCPSIGIGIQLTGASAEASQFVGIAGSHGTSAHPLMTEEQLEGMPLVPIDTDPGDVTLHICDVIHASPPPAGAGGRRTLYLTWFPPTMWDAIGPGEAANDMVMNRGVSPEAIASGAI